jgi:hypothetical protein
LKKGRDFFFFVFGKCFFWKKIGLCGVSREWQWLGDSVWYRWKAEIEAVPTVVK